VLRPGSGSWRLLAGLHDHAQTHRTRLESSGRGIRPMQRSLPDHTQNSQETDIHPLDGIRTRIPSQRVTTDLRLRPRRHRYQQIITSIKLFTLISRSELLCSSFLNFSSLKPDSYNNQSTRVPHPLLFLPVKWLADECPLLWLFPRTVEKSKCSFALSKVLFL